MLYVKNLTELIAEFKELQTAFRESGDFASAKRMGSLMRQVAISYRAVPSESSTLECGAPLRSPGSATIDPDVAMILRTERSKS